MPYKKFSRRRRFTRKPRRNFIKKMAGEPNKVGWLESIGRGVGTVAGIARTLAPVVSMINTEMKFKDISNTSNTTGGTAVFWKLCDVSQGTTDQTRIGDSVLLQDVQAKFAIKLTVSNAATTPIYGAYYRIMLFIWKSDATDNVPDATKLFSTTNIFSTVNKDYSDQFIILKDIWGCLNAPAIPSKTDVAGNFVTAYTCKKIYKKLGIHARYRGSVISTNQPYIYYISDNPITITMNTRVNFTDN